jgi:hypothetical protein
VPDHVAVFGGCLVEPDHAEDVQRLQLPVDPRRHRELLAAVAALSRGRQPKGLRPVHADGNCPRTTWTVFPQVVDGGGIDPPTFRFSGEQG